ncbi:hypothetical protein BJV77DRAFT_958310 [Russula vinacea]|nr:hypothetical protein BJV77DRAFT_958310 [Russula vinacea]
MTLLEAVGALTAQFCVHDVLATSAMPKWITSVAAEAPNWYRYGMMLLHEETRPTIRAFTGLPFITPEEGLFKFAKEKPNADGCPLSPRQFPQLQIPKHARESLPLDRATLRFDILQVVKEGVANEARTSDNEAWKNAAGSCPVRILTCSFPSHPKIFPFVPAWCLHGDWRGHVATAEHMRLTIFPASAVSRSLRYDSPEAP